MNSISSDDGRGGGDYFNEDRNTQKVYFKEARVDSDVNMVVDLVPAPRISWKDKLLEGETVGSMAFSMDYDIIDREDFVFTNGDILQSTINGILWVEFESLLVVCFSCGRYGHVKGLYPSAVAYLNLSGGKEMKPVSVIEGSASMEAEGPFGPWMIIEHKSRRNKKDTRIQKVNIMAKRLTRSRFDVLSLIDNGNVGAGETQVDISGIRFQQCQFLKKLRGKVVGPRVEPFCEKTEVTKVVGQVDKNGPGEPNVNMAMVKNGSSLENIGPALVMLDGQLAIEGLILVEGFGNTSLYFNPMFEGPIESVVELNSGILDPKQNSMVFFKENDDPDFTKAIIKEGPIGHSKSQLAFKREHRPDLIGLLEMRVSGGKVDSIIAKLEFLFSHHIKMMVIGIWTSFDYGFLKGSLARLWGFPRLIQLLDTIESFGGYLGSCNVLDTELWGILDGFKLILDLGFERVLIQIDNLEAVNAIQDGSFRNSNFTLVRRIHQLLAIVEHWRPQHIPREENKIIDGLINMVRDRRT
ncbi:hypothetical protein Goshw_022179 [Gossypium schwendimanii]|uniref:RNase H type-1 domain-containing protein n=1 Tax=Gossypium schwendimanii TaxID=34291 RepID=A0A7J9LB50_GOSSC|nr:hypothetical protein [Gossypium schwendimanii]